MLSAHASWDVPWNSFEDREPPPLTFISGSSCMLYACTDTGTNDDIPCLKTLYTDPWADVHPLWPVEEGEPIPFFPREIAKIIFCYLTRTELLKAAPVSKLWEAFAFRVCFLAHPFLTHKDMPCGVFAEKPKNIFFSTDFQEAIQAFDKNAALKRRTLSGKNFQLTIDTAGNAYNSQDKQVKIRIKLFSDPFPPELHLGQLL